MIHQLPTPAGTKIYDEAITAFADLHGSGPFNKIMKYLEFSSAFITEKFKASKNTYHDNVNKGALQVIDDLREIDAHSVEWAGDILNLKRKQGRVI